MGGLFLLLEAAEKTGWSENVWIAFLPAITAAIPGIIAGIAQIKDKKYKKLTDLVESSNEDNKRSLRENKELIEEIKRKLEAQDEIDDLHRQALMTLLREDIDDAYEIFYKKQGWMCEEDKDELRETYEIYAKLGGNHVGERKYNRMMELPENPQEAAPNIESNIP